MKIGVPKEIKNHEYRVAMTPDTVSEVVARGHDVFIEHNAAFEIGFSDDDYIRSGAKIVSQAKDVFAIADMIVKVKEPQPIECQMLRAGQVLFTYLHLAADPRQAEGLMVSGATCIAYETITDDQNHLPLLAPMSEVAGRMSVQVGATALEKAHGGRGVLLSGVPGVQAAHVLVIGGGVVGTNAARIALGMGAQVTILDKNLKRLKELDELFGPHLKTQYASREALLGLLKNADLVIGAVLIPGASAPKLVLKDDLKLMKKGSVLVDVAIDQGGCFETSKPTTHQSPTYVVDDIVHYCVANMPGAVARTSTEALTYATLPYILKIANHQIADDCHLLNGLQVYKGQITHPAVAEALGLNYQAPSGFYTG